MKLFAGLENLDLPARFYSAQKQIVMHAAIYGPFGRSALYTDSLLHALAQESFGRMDIIAVTADSPKPLQDQFLDLLRSDYSEQQKTEELADSDRFLHSLKKNFPLKVHIHPLHLFSCQPVIIIDNTLIFGQYTNCKKRAADGFWGVIETDIQKLFSHGTNAPELPVLNQQETAAYRLVVECTRAMTPETA